MTRSECARLAGIASGKSPRKYSFFCDGPRDAVEAVFERNAIVTPEKLQRLRAMAGNRKGRKLAKPPRKQWKMLTK